MAKAVSRRSFFVECMTFAAGAALALGGGGLLAAGCGGPVVKYGGVPPDIGQSPDLANPDMPVVKYGGPPDMATPDDMPVVKYGGPPDMAVPTDGPTTKYGGPLVG